MSAMNKSVLVVTLMLSAAAWATEYPDPIVIAAGETYPITTASGTTDTYSGAITGEGKLSIGGIGTTILSNPNNTYSGGTLVTANGRVYANASGAFGTGDVRNKDVSATVCFNAPEGVFPNNFGRTATTGYTRLAYYFYTNTTISGAIDFPGSSAAVGFQPGGSTASWQPTNVMYVAFNGDWTGIGIACEYLIGKVDVNGQVALTGNLVLGSADASSGWVEFNHADNSVGGGIYINKVSVECGAENALGGAYIGPMGKYNAGSFLLNGFDQQVKAIRKRPPDTSTGYKDNFINPGVDATCTAITSDSPATLTITGYSGQDPEAPDTCYMAIDGEVSVALTPADSTFTQVFADRHNRTTGALMVESGILEMRGQSTFKNASAIQVAEGASFLMNSQEAEALVGVQQLTIDGDFACAYDSPMPLGELDTLALGANAQLTLPYDAVLVVKTLTVGGEEVRGRIESGDIRVPQLLGGTIQVDPPLTGTWSGQGDSTAIGLGANWESGEAPNFASTAAVTFSAADAVTHTATVDVEVTLGSLLLNDACGFTFAATDFPHTITLGANGLTVAAATGMDEPVYDFEVPLAAAVAQVWTVGEGTVLKLEDGSSAPVVTEATVLKPTVTKNGVGRLEVGGLNVWDGMVIVNDGDVLINGAVTTSTGADATQLSGGDDGKIWNAQNAFFCHMNARAALGTTGGVLTLSNAVIDKAFMVQTYQPQYYDSTYPYFVAAAGTDNQINGYFRTCDATYQGLRIEENAMVSFNGGGRLNWAFGLGGKGTAMISGAPFINYSSNTAGLYVTGGGRLIYAIANNSMNYTGVGEAGGTLETSVDYAFGLAGGNVYLTGASAGQGSVLEVDDTVQHFKTLKGSNDKQATNAAIGDSWITGYAGSLIMVTNTALASVSSLSRVPFKGAVSYCHSAVGPMTISTSASTSTGSLEVKLGTVTFAGDASWLTAAEVRVTGEGRLELSAGETVNHQTFGKKTDLRLAGTGVIAVPSGVTQAFHKLYVGDEEIPEGTYTYATAPASLQAHLDSAAGGAVRVCGDPEGLMILIR